MQPCAPGSKNSYQYGNSYYYRDFCDVNLVDDGYTLHHGYQADGYKPAAYGNGAGYGYSGGVHAAGYAPSSLPHGHAAGYGYAAGYNAGYGPVHNVEYGVSGKKLND